MVVGVAASILSHIWGPAAIIGEIATYVGAVSTVTGLADSLPEGDYDAYVVTITWDIPYVELPSSNNTPRLIGYSHNIIWFIAIRIVNRFGVCLTTA